MALYHKWDVKNDFAYMLQIFSLISDSLGKVALMAQTVKFMFSNVAYRPTAYKTGTGTTMKLY